ncbi:hypothetical protein AVEN_198104-1 [Araneus ventricosus]|uniref:Uncharacterized protein n=1 Tax=Araneus ventricosus TaxID=182803 RepID=A0A4Y2MDP4_ARAVE|nr:hypothetical protein AVEN_198104-1 [Araneus ventricosus]
MPDPPDYRIRFSGSLAWGALAKIAVTLNSPPQILSPPPKEPLFTLRISVRQVATLSLPGNVTGNITDSLPQHCIVVSYSILQKLHICET